MCDISELILSKKVFSWILKKKWVIFTVNSFIHLIEIREIIIDPTVDTTKC